MKTPLVSVIIINWNGKDFLEICLKSLEKQEYKKIEIIVVDNNSTDGSVNYLKKSFPKVKIIINKENLGFAQANNIGFANSSGECILFLNNDTQVTPNFLTNLIRVVSSGKKIGGAQSKILLMDDKTRLDSVGAFFTSSGFLYHFGFRKKDIPKYNKSIPLFSAKGAAMIFRREVLEKILVKNELFDNKYFAYSEESDLCHRVWLSGSKIVYAPKSVIYHKVGGTSKRINESFIQYHSFKNRINSYVKNLSSQFLLKVLPLHILLCLIASFSYLIRGQVGISVAIFKAFIWNITNLNQTLAQRAIIQSRIRKISDRKFLPGLTIPIGINYFIAHLRGLENYED